MSTQFPSTRNLFTIPEDVTETEPLETGDLLNHPNGVQYVYNDEGTWTIVKRFLSPDYIQRNGDTMEGPLFLEDAIPTNELEAIPKRYVDNVDKKIIPLIIALS